MGGPAGAGQAIRNEDDMECMSVPIKYRSMGTFYKVKITHRICWIVCSLLCMNLQSTKL